MKKRFVIQIEENDKNRQKFCCQIRDLEIR